MIEQEQRRPRVIVCERCSELATEMVQDWKEVEVNIPCLTELKEQKRWDPDGKPHQFCWWHTRQPKMTYLDGRVEMSMQVSDSDAKPEDVEVAEIPLAEAVDEQEVIKARLQARVQSEPVQLPVYSSSEALTDEAVYHLDMWVQWARELISDLRGGCATLTSDLADRDKQLKEQAKKLREQEVVIEGVKAWMRLHKEQSREYLKPGTEVTFGPGIRGKIEHAMIYAKHVDYGVIWWANGLMQTRVISSDELEVVDTEVLPYPANHLRSERSNKSSVEEGGR